MPRNRITDRARNNRISAERLIDRLAPLEPRAASSRRPYMPGDCPITEEQLRQHTYIAQQITQQQRAHDEATRMFLGQPAPQPETWRVVPGVRLLGFAGVVAIWLIAVGMGWATVELLRWVAELVW